MKITSTNISNPRIIYDGKREITTGIFKKPVSEGVFLGKTDVMHDAVMDRKHHGGNDKACYLYSEDHYPFWKKKYPNLEWHMGMFGENLTVKGLDETQVFIGDTFQVGEAVVQVSEPRRPCNVLGLKFEDKGMIKEFLNQPYPGIYVRVLKEGRVKEGDEFFLTEQHSQDSLTIEQVYSLFSYNKSNTDLKLKALDLKYLSQDCKNSLQKKSS